ncbi:MAG: ATP phosphoribosyltransferase [Candidatus Altiarchaeales archaeon]|nr:ATP phosphoribosyltransferase [Candidatus Altiarchaeales archaeon]
MLKIAIPNKGRLSKPALALLNEAGIKVESGRQLFCKCGDIEILFVRANDIPEYVQDGAADLGITGIDIVKETEARVNVLLKLGFGRSKLVVASPKNSSINSKKDIKNGLRVATEFPNLTKKYFKKIGKKARILKVSGATEITPYLGVADLIVDLSSTGTTLELNNLRAIDTLLETEAVLIGSKKYIRHSIATSLKSVIDAKGMRYLMVNVPVKKLEMVKKTIPSMESPTIIDLAEKNYKAVHTVVQSSQIHDLIHNLKKLGCKDILVLSIESLVK